MRQFRPQIEEKFKYKKLLHSTLKAYLFEISPEISIWVARSRVIRKGKTFFAVKNHHAADIRMSINAEKKELRKK